jgi:hypothetical protein
MMTMTIANWKLMVQVRHQPPAATDESQAVVQRARRRQLAGEVARARDRAETRRLLLGGPYLR